MLDFLKDKVNSQPDMLQLMKYLISGPRPLDALRWAEKNLSNFNSEQALDAIAASRNVILAKEYQPADTYTIIVLDNCVYPQPPMRDRKYFTCKTIKPSVSE